MLIIQHTVIGTYCVFGFIQDIEHKRGQDWHAPCPSGAWNVAVTINQQINKWLQIKQHVMKGINIMK